MDKQMTIIPKRNGLRQTPLKCTPFKVKSPFSFKLKTLCISKKRRLTINRLSLAKIAEINAEVPERIALCYRAQGIPVQKQVTVRISGKPYVYTKVKCVGGICECGCNKPADGLEPHEKVNRGRGGKLCLENTLMVTRACHRRLQGSEPMWTKGANVRPNEIGRDNEHARDL